jgi:hypothetical protein
LEAVEGDLDQRQAITPLLLTSDFASLVPVNDNVRHNVKERFDMFDFVLLARGTFQGAVWRRIARKYFNVGISFDFQRTN